MYITRLAIVLLLINYLFNVKKRRIMILISVQNPENKSAKVVVVHSEKVVEFLENYIPKGCVALVQDVPYYDGLDIDEFKKKYYGD